MLNSAHMVLSHRSNNYLSLGPRFKSYVKWLRWFQLALRLFELVASAGLVVLMILVTKVDDVNKWIMRITVSLRMEQEYEIAN